MTIEGYFGDPAYGGNRGGRAWAMIGFPGAYGNYYDLVDKHGIAFDVPPRSLAQDGAGHVHEMPPHARRAARARPRSHGQGEALMAATRLPPSMPWCWASAWSAPSSAANSPRPA
jgi:hypothetical protein